MAYTQIRIPSNLNFGKLNLSRDPVTGDIEFDAAAIRNICDDNNITMTEDTITAIMVAWYRHHRQAGGEADTVMERLLAEMDAEAVGVEIREDGQSR